MQRKFKKLEFEPYRGPSGEVIEGKNTVLKLFEDRLEFRMKFNALTYFSRLEEDEEQLKDYVDHFKEGVISKEAITGMSKEIEPLMVTVDGGKGETETTKKSKFVFFIETHKEYDFYVEKEEDWHRIYKEVYNWKYNIEDE